MIVDDLSANLRILSEMIRTDVYDPRPVSNGKIALEMARRDPPDLILLDIRMPDMDGFEVCRRLKADPKLASIPVIFLTAEHDTEQKVKAFSLGGVDYITKPFAFGEVHSRIATHLKLHALQNELEKNNALLEERVAVQVTEISEAQLAIIFALVKIAERRDDDTGRHVERVQHLSRLLSQALREESDYRTEIDDRFIKTIFQTSALHDVGKVAIPDAVLLKPGKFTPDDFGIMMTHPTIGAETLNEVYCHYPNNFFIAMGTEIALGHHERWDGGGYPQAKAGAAIPLSARIVAVVDFFDAVSSDRVYRRAIPHAEVMTMLREGNGKHFDPRIIEVFLAHEVDLTAAHASMIAV